MTSRRCPILAATLCAFVAWPSVALARPFDWGEDVTTPKWPKDSTINIFIPEHPTDATANDNLKMGIDRWQAKLTPYGITLNVILHAPQEGDPSDNRVTTTWEDTLPDGDVGKGDAAATGDDITSGAIRIKKSVSGAGYQKNLGMHEFGHVMGLDDDATGSGKPHNCMDHSVETTGEQGFTARDCAEIESLYGAVDDGKNAEGDVQGQSQEVGTGLWEYQYDVSWTNGPEIPILEVFIGVPASQVVLQNMPPGWQLDSPPVLLDGLPIPTPGPDDNKLHFYAEDPDAALRSGNAFGSFSVLSTVPPGQGLAHAMIDPGTSGKAWTTFPVPTPGNSPAAVPSLAPLGVVILGGALAAAGLLAPRLRGCRREDDAQGSAR